MSAKREKQPLKGDALVNKVALSVIEVIILALIFGYIADYKSGIGTLASFLALEIVAIPSFFIVLMVYKKRPEKMRYVAFVCFALVYAVCNFCASIDLVFVMMFPMIVVFILYYDYKLIKWMCCTFGLISAADVVLVIFIQKEHHSGLPINSSMLLIYSIGILIFLCAVVTVTNISILNNKEKIDTIQGVADKINASIKGINGEIGSLTESSEMMKTAMQEINSGVGNTAEAVQNQLLQTEAIQDKIEIVQSAAGNISENVSTTMSAVAEGNRGIESLVEQADTSVNISEKVVADLNVLKDNIEAMGSITKMIENVAFQTNIMALNANVEAAHAGEAGKGFAVVAGEISNMSAKTKEATDNISDLIENATSSLNELVASVTEMAGVIASEREQTSQTSDIFASIQSSTMEVQQNVMTFLDHINGLTEANREIVQSVQTISAVSEEVTALTNETLNMEESNAAAIDSIAEQVRELAEE